MLALLGVLLGRIRPAWGGDYNPFAVGRIVGGGGGRDFWGRGVNCRGWLPSFLPKGGIRRAAGRLGRIAGRAVAVIPAKGGTRRAPGTAGRIVGGWLP